MQSFEIKKAIFFYQKHKKSDSKKKVLEFKPNEPTATENQWLDIQMWDKGTDIPQKSHYSEKM